jgi:type III secretion protein I
MIDPSEKIAAISLDALQSEADGSLARAPSLAELDGVGAQFLDALGDAKQNISERASNIESSLQSSEAMTPGELMKIQVELAQLTLEQELISKGVSKTTQNVDTLIKAQ